MNQGRSEREVIEVGHINSHLLSQPLDMEAGRPRGVGQSGLPQTLSQILNIFKRSI